MIVCRDDFLGFPDFSDWCGDMGRISLFRAVIWLDTGQIELARVYAALMAAISGAMPMIFMTRIRL